MGRGAARSPRPRHTGTVSGPCSHRVRQSRSCLALPLWVSLTVSILLKTLADASRQPSKPSSKSTPDVLLSTPTEDLVAKIAGDGDTEPPEVLFRQPPIAS